MSNGSLHTSWKKMLVTLIKHAKIYRSHIFTLRHHSLFGEWQVSTTYSLSHINIFYLNLYFLSENCCNNILSSLVSNQLIKWKQTYNLCLFTFTLSNFKRKIWTWTRDSNSDLQTSSLALYHWAIRFRFKFFSLNLIM